MKYIRVKKKWLRAWWWQWTQTAHCIHLTHSSRWHHLDWSVCVLVCFCLQNCKITLDRCIEDTAPHSTRLLPVKAWLLPVGSPNSSEKMEGQKSVTQKEKRKAQRWSCEGEGIDSNPREWGRGEKQTDGCYQSRKGGTCCTQRRGEEGTFKLFAWEKYGSA